MLLPLIFVAGLVADVRSPTQSEATFEQVCLGGGGRFLPDQVRPLSLKQVPEEIRRHLRSSTLPMRAQSSVASGAGNFFRIKELDGRPGFMAVEEFPVSGGEAQRICSLASAAEPYSSAAHRFFGPDALTSVDGKRQETGVTELERYSPAGFRIRVVRTGRFVLMQSVITGRNEVPMVRSTIEELAKRRSGESMPKANKLNEH